MPHLSDYYQHDRYSPDWIAAREREYNQQRVELLLKKTGLTNFSGKVIDLGCGDGGILKYIGKQFPDTQLYGADLSKTGVALAKKNKGVKAKVVDFDQKLPYKSNFFNFILNQEVIEHLQDPDSFMEEMYRVLKPGGSLILTTPNLLAWFQRALCVIGIVPTFHEVSKRNRQFGLGPLKKVITNTQPVGHIHVFTPAALTDMLTTYGFEVVKVAGARVPHRFPQPVGAIYNGLDTVFQHLPSLASDTVVWVRKPEKGSFT